MCDYCGCRDIVPIRELSDQHERIGALMGEIRTLLGQGGEVPASGSMAVLQEILASHLALEEMGIFAQLAGRPGLAWYLDQLEADHARARSGLLSVDPARPGWSNGVPAALDELAAHIEVEEHDLFPASRVIISDAGWEQVSAVHRELAGGALVASITAGAGGPLVGSFTQQGGQEP
jgi:hypothetical protein